VDKIEGGFYFYFNFSKLLSLKISIYLAMQKIYLNALNQISNLGPKRIFHLLKLFNNQAQQVWNATWAELKGAKLSNKALTTFCYERKSIEPNLEWEKLVKLGIDIILHPKIDAATQQTSQYPALLAEIPAPPPLLYIKGKIDPIFTYRIAVVGSRKVTIYGRRTTEKIAYNLALNKIVIVSGLALGVDTIAHQACLKAGAPTIAVLANGLDKIYPITNANLAQQIISQKGSLVSEFPLGTLPLKQHFPRRNRIISGLCQAVLITEAALKSGSLLTANHALEQNRDVFAIPGSIYNQNSEGTNSLIKQGAKLATSAQDILLELNLQNSSKYVKTRKILPSSPIQQKIYDNLSKEPLLLNDLIKKINLPTGKVNSALTLMEIKGIIKNLGGGQYVLI
jgi:DNA processing protein